MHRILPFLLALLFTAGAAVAQSSSSSTSASSLATDYKVNVLAASATAQNIDLSQINFTLTTIDGVVITGGNQRFLAKDQTVPAQNGIYITPSINGAAAVRAVDANTWAELPGAQVTAAGGATNAGKIFVCTAPATGTLGVTAVPWTTPGAAVTLAAGTHTGVASALSNVTAPNLTINEGQWMRVGNTVTYSTRYLCTQTASGATSFQLTLPVASDFGAVEDAAGIVNGIGGSSVYGNVIANVANNTLFVRFAASVTTSQEWCLVVTYQVIAP